MRSSAGCKTTQSELKTVFTHKFETNATNRSRQVPHQENADLQKNSKKSRPRQGDPRRSKPSKETPQRDRVAALNPRAKIKRVTLTQQRRDDHLHETLNALDSEQTEERQRLAAHPVLQAQEPGADQRNCSFRSSYTNEVQAPRLRPLEPALLPDLAPVPLLTGIRVDNREGMSLCVRGNSKPRQAASPPRLVPVSKLLTERQAVDLDVAAVDPQAYQYHLKSTYQNSFFNS